MKQTKIWVGVIIVVVVIAGLVVWNIKNNPLQNSSDFKKEVSFCGKVYKTNGAVVSGTEVVEKIAQIATQNPNNYVCNNLSTNFPSTSNLLAELTKQKNTDVDYKDNIYFLKVAGSFFKLDSNTNTIYILSGFDGSPTFYGNIK